MASLRRVCARALDTAAQKTKRRAVNKNCGVFHVSWAITCPRSTFLGLLHAPDGRAKKAIQQRTYVTRRRKQSRRGKCIYYSFQRQRNQTCSVAPDTLLDCRRSAERRSFYFSLAATTGPWNGASYDAPIETVAWQEERSPRKQLLETELKKNLGKLGSPRPVAINQNQYNHPRKNMGARDACPVLAPPPPVLTHEATSAQVEFNRDSQHEMKQ